MSNDNDNEHLITQKNKAVPMEGKKYYPVSTHLTLEEATKEIEDKIS